MAIQIIRDQEQAAQLREAGLLWRCYGGTKLEMLEFKPIAIGPEADALWEAGLLWTRPGPEVEWYPDSTTDPIYSPTRWSRTWSNDEYAILLEE